MLYICIPAYNEAATIGVLIWRIRKVFQNYSREYEILVYDDGSTDGTSETAAPYADVAPVTIIRGEGRKGYAAALDVLAREANRRTRYPRRDAMVVMQGDFTDQPEHLPELIKRFEGGADIVLAERTSSAEPVAVTRLRKLAPWAIRFAVGVGGITDPFAAFRLYRLSIVRELAKASPDKPLITTDGWAANVEFLFGAMPLARRVERVSLASRYDLRVRQSRIRPFADSLALYRFGRAFRGRRISLPVQVAPSEKGPRQRGFKRPEQVTS
ncbi:MAG TPA: glycosyltransferase family 2 protein [Gemmatimonadaceae bacterium]|nr:glycosyltransferase family 2 protein [Gemmatimonadaceae bacterium]